MSLDDMNCDERSDLRKNIVARALDPEEGLVDMMPFFQPKLPDAPSEACGVAGQAAAVFVSVLGRRKAGEVGGR